MGTRSLSGTTLNKKVLIVSKSSAGSNVLREKMLLGPVENEVKMRIPFRNSGDKSDKDVDTNRT